MSGKDDSRDVMSMKRDSGKRAKNETGKNFSQGVWSLNPTAAAFLCGLLIIALSVSTFPMFLVRKGKVYAASGQQESRIQKKHSGIGSSMSGRMKYWPGEGSRINRVGTSCENVLVGQRVKTVKRTGRFNISDAVQKTVDQLEERAAAVAAVPCLMSDADYSVLLKIVEAEAGEDDVKGRVLVANVVMNRVKRPDFPDNVTDVVFQDVNGVPQFAPVYFGSIYNVTVTDETREAVRQALSGVDYSQGALFFIQKSAAEKSSITWFDTDLKWLFKEGVHDFYTYKDETDPLKA